MSYSLNSVNPVVLTLAYHLKGHQNLDKDNDDDKHDNSGPIPVPRHRSNPGYRITPGYPRNPHQRHSQPPRSSVFKRFLKAIVVILLVLLIGGSLIGANWAQGQMQNYVTMHNGNTLVAQARVTPQGEFMTVDLVLFDNRGHTYLDSECNNCRLKGDGIELGGDTVTYSGLLGTFLQSGFKLTNLKSLNHKPELAKTYQSEDVVLNSGNDTIFYDMQGWVSIFGAKVAQIKSGNIPADGQTYDMFISPTKGLHITLGKPVQ